MKAPKTFSVSFHIKSQKAKNGKAPIYVRITVEKERSEISIKRSVEVQNWNNLKGEAKPKNEELKKLNTFLEHYRFSIINIYQNLMITNQDVSSNAIKNSFLGIENDVSEEMTLCKLIEYHNYDLKDTLEWGTMKNYYTTEKYLKLFIKKSYKNDDLKLSEIKYKFLQEFSLFLKKYKNPRSNSPCNQNTIMKHIERLRKMIGLAIKNEWIEKDPFISFKPKYIKNERGYLTTNELKAVEEKHFKIDRLAIVKDIFVFACYTGLAYVDVSKLTLANIVEGEDGKLWIHTKRKKTSSPVKIPLLDKASIILKKYQNHPMSKGCLPILSNQRLNSYLKEIADCCGINKNLTFHIARHTFATTVTLSNGVPIETVSKLLGHSSIRTTQIYAKVIEKKLSEDMSKLNGKLS